MPQKMLITLELARALDLRERGCTDAHVAKCVGRDTASSVRNSLFAWVKREKLLLRKVVMWPQLLELIDSGQVDHEPDARRLIAARVAGSYWDPDNADMFAPGDPVAPQEQASSTTVAPNEQEGSPTVAPQKQDSSTPVASLFTAAEVEALKMVAAHQMKAPTDSVSLRSGELQPTHYRVDVGLKQRMNDHARAEGLKVFEVVNRAFERYLGGNSDA